MAIRPHHLERGVPYGGAEEGCAFVSHLEEPTSPAPRPALGIRLGEVTHDRHCFIARGRTVRKLHAFLIGVHAVSEAQKEEIARHYAISIFNPQRLSSTPGH